MGRNHDHPGRPHYPTSVIGGSEPFDEGKNSVAMGRNDDHPGRPHYPTSVIGGSEPFDEGKTASQWGGMTITPAAHTTPYRLSVGFGKKVNQFAGFEKRNSQIAKGCCATP